VQSPERCAFFCYLRLWSNIHSLFWMPSFASSSTSKGRGEPIKILSQRAQRVERTFLIVLGVCDNQKKRETRVHRHKSSQQACLRMKMRNLFCNNSALCAFLYCLWACSPVNSLIPASSLFNEMKPQNSIVVRIQRNLASKLSKPVTYNSICSLIYFLGSRETCFIW
jgi:hypothetical protein